MSIKATRSDPEHLPCAIIIDHHPADSRTDICEEVTPTIREHMGDNQTAVAYTVDMGGGKSSVCTYEEQSPTLTCTHYGELAVAYGVTTKGKRVETNTCFSQLTIIQDVTGAMENQLGWGIKQSETMYTINGTQISGVAYLIARLDNAEIL